MAINATLIELQCSNYFYATLSLKNSYKLLSAMMIIRTFTFFLLIPPSSRVTLSRFMVSLCAVDPGQEIQPQCIHVCGIKCVVQKLIHSLVLLLKA